MHDIVDFWIAAVAFTLVVVARLIGRRWFVRRWLANGMTPTRAAVLSIAVSEVPVIAGFVTFAWVSGRFSPGGVALVIGLILLPSLVWFGLRRAGFQYMEQHGVRDELGRRQP